MQGCRTTDSSESGQEHSHAQHTSASDAQAGQLTSDHARQRETASSSPMSTTLSSLQTGGIQPRKQQLCMTDTDCLQYQATFYGTTLFQTFHSHLCCTIWCGLWRRIAHWLKFDSERTMPYLIDGQSLCLLQGPIVCECILLEKEAHAVGAGQKVLVCLLCLHDYVGI